MQKYFVLALMIAISLAIFVGSSAGSLFPGWTLERETLKEFQPLTAAIVAFLGILIGALASFAKTASEEDARREAGKSIERALHHRVRGLLAHLGGDAMGMLYLKPEELKDSYANHAHLGVIRERLIRAQRARDELYAEVPKVPLQRIGAVTELLNSMGMIIEEMSSICILLERIDRVPDTVRDKQIPVLVRELDVCCLMLNREMRRIDPDWEISEPIREGARNLWGQLGLRQKKGTMMDRVVRRRRPSQAFWVPRNPHFSFPSMVISEDDGGTRE